METLNDLFPSKYLKASDFADGPRVLKIKSFDIVDLKARDGSDERKPVVYFENEPKGLILNKTNRNSIETICNSIQIAEIIGNSVELYLARVDSFGELVDAVRIREPRQMTPAQKWASYRKDNSIDDDVVMSALQTLKPSEWIAQADGRTIDNAIEAVNAYIESQF